MVKITAFITEQEYKRIQETPISREHFVRMECKGCGFVDHLSPSRAKRANETSRGYVCDRCLSITKSSRLLDLVTESKFKRLQERRKRYAKLIIERKKES